MKKLMVSVVVGAMSLMIVATGASAGLIGDQIDGVLNFGGYGTTNFFSPATATVGSGTEFSYSDAFSYINADFMDAGLFNFQGLTNGGGPANTWNIYFTDIVKSITSFELVGTNIAGLVVDLNNGVLGLHNTQVNGTIPGTGWFAMVSINTATAVPEPTTLILLGSGLVGLCFVGRRMKS